ncbi:MAG: hypothetical protein [Caudoviricetes sp.]|nr:MAG: hypothetical protein [Caudoviricetes sp.]
MQVDTQAFVNNIESVYIRDIQEKNHEIAMLRAANAQLQSELDKLNQPVKKEG